MKKLTFSAVIVNILVWIMSLTILVPMLVVIVNAFKTQKESAIMSLKLPEKLMFENFATVIEKGKLWTSFLNSSIYSISSVLLILLVVSAASFALSRNRSKLNRFIFYFILLGIAMPINNVALMKVMKSTMLINTRLGIVLLYAAINIPLSLFLMYGFVNVIPKEVDEAAILDGCTPIKLFLNIILPLMSPILVTVLILNFMSIWNDFTLPLYFMNNSEKWPMTLAVYNFFGQFEKSWNLVSADIVLTMIPVLFVFILGQKYIVGGVSAGAVKG